MTLFTMYHDTFHRVIRLIGNESFDKLQQARVIIFGVGGVGSWTAESLVRSGISHITIVDADSVAASNINRQLMALQSTVGLPKVQVLAKRLVDINPECEIITRQIRYDEESANSFDFEQYDVIIDAIDSLSDKALLIIRATEARRPRLFSSMGAALKIDPTRIRVDEFWKVKGCRLAAALRGRFKKLGIRPRRKFRCVYSDELLPNDGPDEPDHSGAMTYDKVAVNGAMAHITAIFGMTLAGLAIQYIKDNYRQ